jgi:hypothetical protein
VAPRAAGRYLEGVSFVREFVARARGAPRIPDAGDWQRRLDRGELDMSAYVYFVQAGPRGSIKIGYSATPERRFGDLRTANAHKLIVLGLAKGGAVLEGSLHVALSQYRQEGEWFRAAARVVTAVHEVLSDAQLKTAGIEPLQTFIDRVAEI